MQAVDLQDIQFERFGLPLDGLFSGSSAADEDDGWVERASSAIHGVVERASSLINSWVEGASSVLGRLVEGASSVRDRWLGRESDQAAIQCHQDQIKCDRCYAEDLADEGIDVDQYAVEAITADSMSNQAPVQDHQVSAHGNDQNQLEEGEIGHGLDGLFYEPLSPLFQQYKLMPGHHESSDNSFCTDDSDALGSDRLISVLELQEEGTSPLFYAEAQMADDALEPYSVAHAQHVSDSIDVAPDGLGNRGAFDEGLQGEEASPLFRDEVQISNDSLEIHNPAHDANSLHTAVTPLETIHQIKCDRCYAEDVAIAGIHIGQDAVEAVTEESSSNVSFSSAGCEQFQIYCNTVRDKTITLDVSSSDTIRAVKAKIEAKEGVSLRNQRLVFGGKQLEDHYPLSHYDIQRELTVNSLLGLRGGKPSKRDRRAALAAASAKEIEKQNESIIADSQDRYVRRRTNDVNYDGVAPSPQIRSLAERHLPPSKQQTDSCFKVGTDHLCCTNLRCENYNGNVYIRIAVKERIVESIGQHLPKEATVKLRGIDYDENRRCNIISYQIIDQANATPDLQPYTLSSPDHVVTIDPFVFPNKAIMSCHPSVRPHFRTCGNAMKSLLEDEGLVRDPLDQDAVIICEGQERKTSFGIYAKLKESGGVLGVEKYGWSGEFLKRCGYYTDNPTLAVVVDLSLLPYNVDIALGLMLEQTIVCINNDPAVPACIRRLLHDELIGQGGDRNGGRRAMIGQCIESAFSASNEGAIMEFAQYDDNILYGLMGKVMETQHKLTPLVETVGPRQDLTSKSVLSWEPAPKRDVHGSIVEDYIYVTIAGIGYIGVDSYRDAYDGPAIPGAISVADRYSKAFTPDQDAAAKSVCENHCQDTNELRSEGCSNLLDINTHLSRKTSTDMATLAEEADLGLRANIYDGQIRTFMHDQALLNLHWAICRSGDINDYFTLDDNATGCLIIETLRRLTMMAKGETNFGPMLAIEAAMAQRLFIDGLHQYTLMRGYIIKEYLSPSDVNGFDQISKGKRMPRHPYYPITKNNRREYMRRVYSQ